MRSWQISSPKTEKARARRTVTNPRWGGGFSFLSLLSGYQFQFENKPNLFAVCGVEVLLNQGSLPWF
jgi:hypothetical protein